MVIINCFLLFVLALFGLYKCQNSEFAEENRKIQAAQEIPHVIREADGCKVYEFKSNGNNHYFTRCGETVSTDRDYTKSCGKGCVKHETETIVTNGNK